MSRAQIRPAIEMDGIEMDGNGRVAGNHFRRQGLAEASEQLRAIGYGDDEGRCGAAVFQHLCAKTAVDL